MRMLAKLLRIPGVRRHQVGDREFRLLLPVDNVRDSAEFRRDREAPAYPDTAEAA
jgi:hypothetical protein